MSPIRPIGPMGLKMKKDLLKYSLQDLEHFLQDDEEDEEKDDEEEEEEEEEDEEV